MSMKKLAILSTYHHYGGLNGTEMHPTPGSPPVPVHGVNVMLGGAMISGIILAVFIFCYCCHKTHRKTQTHLPASYWREPSLSMEIYTVEAQSCFSSDEFLSQENLHHHHHHHHYHHRPPTPGPPPAYDTVVPSNKQQLQQQQEHNNKNEDNELPSYETAVKLQVTGNGYV